MSDQSSIYKLAQRLKDQPDQNSGDGNILENKMEEHCYPEYNNYWKQYKCSWFDFFYLL